MRKAWGRRSRQRLLISVVFACTTAGCASYVTHIAREGDRRTPQVPSRPEKRLFANPDAPENVIWMWLHMVRVHCARATGTAFAGRGFGHAVPAAAVRLWAWACAPHRSHRHLRWLHCQSNVDPAALISCVRLRSGDPRGATRVLLGWHWLGRTGWVGLWQLIIETQFYQIPYFNSFEYGVPWVTQVRCSAAVTGWIGSGSRA
jgi:hypothetical protein